MEYRSEVDGLRAVAVLPVILFHAGFPLFSGGFVGVDIFFVISGYLITRVIYDEIQLGKFSFVHFYERRVRRLVPAIIFVSIACLPFAWMWMLPEELKDFGESLVAVNVFSSNFLFWLETDYFAAASELKPLLHTWSLAVEEQFYLIFPLILLLLVRWAPGYVSLVVGLLCCASLALAVWVGGIDRSANFYLLPTRSWELGFGVLLALNTDLSARAARSIKEIGGLVGLVFIIAAIIFFDDTYLFPGFAALLPTVGTVLILAFATQETAVGRLLSIRPMVLIGLISYSAYLWHQPLLAFARLRLPQEPTETVMLGVVGLSLLLAYLTWRLVEAPFRNKKRFGRNQIFTYAAVTWLIMVAAGLSLHFTNGVPQRNLEAAEIDFRLRHNRGLGRYCSVDDNGQPECKTAGSPELVVWGDSYGKHLVPGILASKPDLKLAQFTKGSCGPIPEVTVVTYPRFTKAWGKECIDFNRGVLQWLVKNGDSVKYVVLGSPFLDYLLDSSSIYTEALGVVPTDREFVLAKFRSTLIRLQQAGVRPVVFAPPLKTGENIGACLKRRQFLRLDLDACNLSARAIKEQEANLRVREFLLEIEKEFQVEWLPDMMCSSDDCPSHSDGIFYYRDWGHLTVEASEYLGEKFDFYTRVTR